MWENGCWYNVSITTDHSKHYDVESYFIQLFSNLRHSHQVNTQTYRNVRIPTRISSRMSGCLHVYDAVISSWGSFSQRWSKSGLTIDFCRQNETQSTREIKNIKWRQFSHRTMYDRVVTTKTHTLSGHLISHKPKTSTFNLIISCLQLATEI